MEIKHIFYKNRKIIYVDHRGATTEEELLDLLYKGIKMNHEEPELNMLLNYENISFTKRYTEEVKQLTKGQMIKIALVGITGLTKVFITAINIYARHKNTKLFNTEAEAKEWLVTQDKSMKSKPEHPTQNPSCTVSSL